MFVCHRTHQGLVRKSNQDTLLIAGGIYGIADGMGGHNGGETASKLAAETMIHRLSTADFTEEALQEAFSAANEAVYAAGKASSELSGMGTTMTVLWEKDGRLLIGHVGDSRAYRFHNDRLERVTQDHSLVAELVRQNLITEEMARTHPYRNVITRAVGIDPEVTADIIQEVLLSDTNWLLCSDGLYGLVEDSRIEAILRDSETPEKAADQLLQEALEAGGTDNVSLLICKADREVSNS